MKQFVTRYQGKYGAVPPILSVLGYDAVQIAGQLLSSARREGNTQPFTARTITRPQGFRGAVGPIRFNGNGIGQRGLAVLEVDRSVFKVVDPSPIGFGAGS
jgi:ABC-type branched-subunit amino acid transport system substrate-binding protein